MSQRTQRKAALQASQQLAWDATHDDLPDAPPEARQTPDAEGQRMRAGEGERRMTALEEWRMRRIKRQLVDLERTNAHDLPSTAFPLPTRDEPMDSPSSDENTVVPQSVARIHRRKNDKRKRGMMTANVKTLVQYRKTLREYLNELPANTPYVTATAPPPSHPARNPCSTCSHPDGKYSCERCGEGACSLGCWKTHRELAVGEGGCGVGFQGMVGFA